MTSCWNKIASLAAALLLGACQSALPPENLADARERWEAQQRQAYQYRLRQTCFCLPEDQRQIRVSVNADASIKAEAVATEAPLSDNLIALARTIPEWFDYIEHAQRQGWHRVEVDYHPVHGFPRRIYIDKRARLADDDIAYYLDQLEQP